MKLLLAATLILMLSAMALAVPDSQKLGPYMVSFENATYQVQIAQPIKNENINTEQMRLFVNNSTFAVIGITKYAEPTDATLKVHKSMMRMNMIIQEGLNASVAKDMTIDGKDGFLVTSMPFKTDNEASKVVYRAMYWLDSQDCECGPVSVGNTSVVITSTFSQDATESLLSSLHIVMGETAQTVPPA